MFKPHSNSYGYKKLLVYKKAEELQSECRRLTSKFPKTKTMIDLADQMDRSARSVKQNIVEGWKRNSTDEYNKFLGFSIAANAELEEDCKDIWNGVHHELSNKKEIMGKKGEKGKMGTTMPTSSHTNSSFPSSSSSLLSSSSPRSSYSSSSPPSSSSRLSHSTPSPPLKSQNSETLDIEKLKFYPLDTTLPPIVQLYLRTKEMNFLIEKLQKSLTDKMKQDGTMSQKDRILANKKRQKEEDEWLAKTMAEQGFIKLPNGQVVSKEKLAKMKEEGKI